MANKEKLFSEFTAPTKQEWIDKIIVDLKGADFEKKMVWRTNEGFNVQPFYRREDLEGLKTVDSLPGEFPFVRGNKKDNNLWFVRQNIEVTDAKEANKKALDFLMKGVDSLGFHFPGDMVSKETIEALLEGIEPECIELNFRTCQGKCVELAKILVDYFKAKGVDPMKCVGSINFDPLTYRLRHNMFWKSAEEDLQQSIELLEINGCMRNFKVINVNGIVLHNAGATIVQELAYTLNMANEYLAFCTEKGLKPEKVASRMQLTLSVGSNYFMEIAKLRATRLLWSTMVAQYKPECDCAYKIHINTVASTWNKTLYDPYVNMLRSTTEGMSAAIGGSDSISLQPFDVAYKESDEFSRRRFLLRRKPHQLHRGECVETFPKC